MRISLNKINNQLVKPVRFLGGGDSRPLKGAELFNEAYANIYLNAKKKSGKTNVIFKIIKECAGKDTVVIAFVSTIYKDPVWKSIRNYLEKKGIAFEGYTSLFEEGQDILNEVVNSLQQEDESESESEEAPAFVKFYDSDGEGGKPRKPKYLAPEYIFIFDDLSNELKSKSIISLLKKNRHFKCKTIISSQFWNDLDVQSRKQLDYILIFRGMPEYKLREIHRDADLSIDFDVFVKIYAFATSKPYSFLYINTRNDGLRINFDKEIYIDEN